MSAGRGLLPVVVFEKSLCNLSDVKKIIVTLLIHDSSKRISTVQDVMAGD